MTASLTRLITEASVLAGGVHPCNVLGHVWVFTGARWCGCEGSESRGCSVSVHECSACGDCDYGENDEADEIRAECVRMTT
jgi:hypothetical protein